VRSISVAAPFREWVIQLTPFLSPPTFPPFETADNLFTSRVSLLFPVDIPANFNLNFCSPSPLQDGFNHFFFLCPPPSSSLRPGAFLDQLRASAFLFPFSTVMNFRIHLLARVVRSELLLPPFFFGWSNQVWFILLVCKSRSCYLRVLFPAFPPCLLASTPWSPLLVLCKVLGYHNCASAISFLLCRGGVCLF